MSRRPNSLLKSPLGVGVRVFLLLSLAAILTGPLFAQAASAPPDPVPDSTYPNLFYGAIPSNGLGIRPVLVFIHGFRGTASNWWVNNDMYSRAYSAGYRTAFMSMSADNSRNDSDFATNGLVIRTLLPSVLTHYGVSKVYFVGHSEGGLDIESALMDAATLNATTAVFTIDSPNQGTALADCAQGPTGTLCYAAAQFFQLNGPALMSMTTANVAKFRATADPYFTTAGVQFYTLAGTTGTGNIITDLTGLVLTSLVPGVPNDGLVTVPESELPDGYAAEIGQIKTNHFDALQGSESFAYIKSRIDAQEIAAPEFSRIATGGFGDDHNTFMWSMEWFNGKLYVGTGRDVECYAHADDLVQTGLAIAYPVPGCPADYKDLSLQAEIWQYTPETKTWVRVYQSPADIPIGTDQAGNQVFAAEDIVYRGMAVFTEADGTQALYVAGNSASATFDTIPPYNTQGYPNPRILRTTDGVNFTPIPMDPGTFMGDIVANSTTEFKVRGFRDLVVYNGVMYATATDYIGTGSIISSSNPSAGDNAWQAVSPPTATMPVRTLLVFNNYLYVGGGDARVGQPNPNGGAVIPDGYFVYKATNPTTDLSSFTQIITDGAGVAAGQRAHDALSMAIFNNQLYVGTDRPTEMVRLNPDDSWDLLVGPPRDTPQGMKYPLSGMSNGFGNTFTGHFYRMGVYNNQLYLGTWDWSDSLQPLPYFDPVFLYEYGTDLYKTPDGIHWSALSHNGLNDPGNFGIRSFTTTSVGLFLGTTRPFGGAQVWVNQAALDLNGDGVINQLDVDMINAALNTPASGPNDPRDLDQDGVINVLDERILVTQCTQPGCAVSSSPQALAAAAPLAPPTNLQSVSSATAGGNAILSWTASPNAVKYHVYRSNLLPVLSFVPASALSSIFAFLNQSCAPNSNPNSLTCSLLDFLLAFSNNSTIAFPPAWVEVGAVTSPAFHDTPPAPNPSRYFVRAEDAQGNVSVPSNLVQAPSFAAQ
jgi:pimeloyl-ACP methyl ester carboxylesterase